LAPKQAARILHVSRDRQAESEAEQIINDLIEADKNYQNNS
jgi:alpha-galactosidase/6-phospho-beta-glucosidase family protein